MSGMQIQLTNERFLEPRHRTPEVDRLLADCFEHRGVLSANLLPDGVAVTSAAARGSEDCFVLEGRWRSPLLAGERLGAGALLLVPFVFQIEAMSMPHNCIHTLGRPDRTLADLFMRNYFQAACRLEKITCLVSGATAPESLARASRDLARTYLWILKAHFNDKIFSRADATELILANAHLAIFDHESPLLAAGTAEFQALSSRASWQQASDPLPAARATRARALSAFKAT